MVVMETIKREFAGYSKLLKYVTASSNRLNIGTLNRLHTTSIAFPVEPVRAANDQLARASEQSELQERDWRLSVRREVHENLVGHLLRHDLPLDLLSESRVGDGLNPRIIPVITSRVEYHQVRNV